MAEPQPQSHIWNESSLIHYLQFLGGEIRTRRAQLGLTASDRALVLMDQAGAHMSRPFKQIKEKWAQEVWDLFQSLNSTSIRSVPRVEKATIF